MLDNEIKEADVNKEKIYLICLPLFINNNYLLKKKKLLGNTCLK